MGEGDSSARETQAEAGTTNEERPHRAKRGAGGSSYKQGTSLRARCEKAGAHRRSWRVDDLVGGELDINLVEAGRVRREGESPRHIASSTGQVCCISCAKPRRRN